MRFAQLRQLLIGSAISDTLVFGFVDKNETPIRFRSLYEWFFLRVEASTLQLKALGTSGRMELGLVTSLGADVDLDDEDMQPASSSMREVILRDPDASNVIVGTCLWDAFEREGAIECAAFRLELINGQRIFIDPTYHFGLRIGGEEQERIWYENRPAAHVELKF